MNLFFLLLVAAFFRTVNLHSQSVWGDDFICIGFLNEPSFSEFNAFLRIYSPDMSPLYFFTIYTWAGIVGLSPVAIRLFSVLIGIAATGLVYITGYQFFARRVAFLAALFFALSPVQIFHAQDMRGYALTVFFGLLSVSTFLQMLKKEGYIWWFANAIANALLVWTHMAGVLLPLVLGGFLLPNIRTTYRKAFLWAILLGVMLLPLLHYVRIIISMMPPANGALEYSFSGNLITLFLEPFLGEGTYLIWAIPESIYYDEGMVSSCHSYYSGLLSLAHLVLMMTMIGLMAYFTFRYCCPFNPREPHNNEKSWGEIHRRLAYFQDHYFKSPHFFLLFWFWAPRMVLFLLVSYFAPDRTSFRYTLFATPALYFIVALALETMPAPRIRKATTALVLVCFLFLAFSNSVLPTRGGYLEAGKLLATKSPSETIFFSGDSILTPDILAYNARITRDSFKEYSDESFQRALHESQQQSASVWYVLEDTGSGDVKGSLARVKNMIARADMGYSRHYFGGMQKIIVYEIFQRSEETPLPPSSLP